MGIVYTGSNSRCLNARYMEQVCILGYSELLAGVVKYNSRKLLFDNLDIIES
jgi:hypothetical protein